MEKKLYGLIGKRLDYSFSETYFAEKFSKLGLENHSYKNFELNQISELEALISSQKELCGLNVTVPYKEAVMPYLDALDEVAAAIGAVNTIVFKEGKLVGSNSDTYGFQRSLAAMLKPHHERALILGTGGASKAIAYTLKKMGIDYRHVSRTPEEGELAYSDLNDLVVRHFPLIINTTPLGTFPDVEDCPDIPYAHLSERNLLYDLTYNPEVTAFLKEGEAQGAATLNGYRMLVLQAERSWELWNK
ncbi:MAG: shikimate dehydrogenase [Flavobacteriales bacterium]